MKRNRIAILVSLFRACFILVTVRVNKNKYVYMSADGFLTFYRDHFILQFLFFIVVVSLALFTVKKIVTYTNPLHYFPTHFTISFHAGHASQFFTNHLSRIFFFLLFSLRLLQNKIMTIHKPIALFYYTFHYPISYRQRITVLY